MQFRVQLLIINHPYQWVHISDAQVILNVRLATEMEAMIAA